MFFPVKVQTKPSCNLTFSQKSLPGGLQNWDVIRNTGTGNWVGVCNTGTTRIYSSDGETWNLATVTGLTTGVRSLAGNGAGRWTAFPHGVIGGPGQYSTDDGLSWTEYGFKQINISQQGLQYGGGLFVAAGQVDNRGAGFYPIYTSPDGFTWTANGSGIPVVGQWAALAYNGSTWLMVKGTPGGDTNIYVTATQPDGTWTQRALPISKTWSTLVWTGRFWFLNSTDGTVIISYDGINWITKTPTGSGYGGCASADVIGTIVVITSENSVVCSKDDANSWASKTITDAGAARVFVGCDGYRFAVAQYSSQQVSMSQSIHG